VPFLNHASLRFERGHRLFAQLSADATPPLVRLFPPGLQAGVYRDAELTFTATDGYGKPLTFATPGDLRALCLPGDLAPWNCAVLAFLRALPPDHRLVLFWS
jgi:hypothetical protein